MENVQQQQQQPFYNPQFQTIGEEFVKRYYELRDQKAFNELKDFYHPEAFLSFEGDQKMHKPEIIKKLSELPFQKVAHSITTLDCHPIADGGVLVMVVGVLKADDDKPMPFSHTFVLKFAAGNYFIAHEMFRLSLHNIQV